RPSHSAECESSGRSGKRLRPTGNRIANTNRYQCTPNGHRQSRDANRGCCFRSKEPSTDRKARPRPNGRTDLTAPGNNSCPLPTRAEVTVRQLQPVAKLAVGRRAAELVVSRLAAA